MESFTRRKLKKSEIPDVLVAKWNQDSLIEGYVPFPKKLLRCMGSILGESHVVDSLATILAVVDFKRPNLRRRPSIDFLAFTAGLTAKRFRDCLMQLKGQGLLSFTEDSEGIDVRLDGLLERISQSTAEDN